MLEQPTWKIHDSSKLSEYETCPRRFFFTHVLGWRLDQPKHDLYFGESWHKAREFALINGYDDIEKIFKVFMDYYRLQFAESTDIFYIPKTPESVALAILTFAKEYKQDLIENKVLLTETSGTVPINIDGRVLHYRMDSIVQRLSDGKIFSWDHKSAKNINEKWGNKFYLSLQNGTYTHCLYCLYPIDQVLGVTFCGTEFKYLKKGSKYQSQGYHIRLHRVDAFKSADQMNAWLFTVNALIDEIERDFDRLSECKDSDTVLGAFRMSPNACNNYYGCIFHDFCLSWANPLRKCQEPPIGFIQEFWDPSEIETTNKKNLEWR